MIDIIIAFLPQETWLIVFVLAGFLMVFGFRQLALGIMGTIILLAFFMPFVDSFLDSLPPEMNFVLMILFGFTILRMLFGRRVYENVLSCLIYDAIKMPFKFVAWLFRGTRRP